MWEEGGLECVRVRNRRASEVRSPEEVGTEDIELEESWDEVIAVEADGEGEPLLIPMQRFDDTDSTGVPLQAKRSKLQDGPEAVIASDSTPRRLMLSGWGQPLNGKQRSGDHHTCSYALLSAEVPFFQERVIPLSNKFVKGTEAVPVSWNQPDLKILYQFASDEGYLQMASNLKNGRLSNVKGFRVVTLEPVRLINASLKASLEFTFSSTVAHDLKSFLKPLLDCVGVSHHFLFFSANGQKPSPAEDDPPLDAYPSLIITFVTSHSHNSTAMKVQTILGQPQWSTVNLSGSLGSQTPVVLYDQLHTLTKYRGVLPLFSLATGQAGSAMEDSLRLTLLCGSRLREMVAFYQMVLATCEPFVSPSHAIFPLVTRPVCTVELCLLDSSSPLIHTFTMKHPVLHVYVDDVAMVMWQLGKNGYSAEREQECWMVTDPCGNRVQLIDRNALYIEQLAT